MRLTPKFSVFSINLGMQRIFNIIALIGISFLATIQMCWADPFVFPLPGTAGHRPEASIIIRDADHFDLMIQHLDQTQILGSKSGLHTFQTKRSTDGKTIVLQLDQAFELSETIHVQFPDRLNHFLPANYQFQIRSVLHRPDRIYQPEFKTNDTIPNDVLIPTIETFGNVAPGRLFLTPNKGPYDIMLYDNEATPYFWREAQGSLAFNFRRELDDKLAYVDLIPGQGRAVLVMDTCYNPVDTFQIQNGYSTDFHDFILYPNGHSMLMSYDVQTVDMSQIVPGGNPEATVTGLVIQELDANKLPIFEWRSWDHIPITDGNRDRFGPLDFTAATLSYVHGNALDTTADGNIILCSRHLEEVTKIDRQTGDILWRLGGKANQFTFQNDPIGFNAQHHAQFLENGNLLLFDNGFFHEPSQTRVVEYQIDEVNMTATKVWEFQQPDGLVSETGGSVQRLENGNTIIGWGGAVFAGPPVIHEVDPQGNIVLQVSYPLSLGFVYNYRIYKFPWPGDVATSITNLPVQTLELFPNPSVNYLEIRLPEIPEGLQAYQIFDASGKIVQTGGLTEMTSRLDVFHLPEGHYILVLKQNEKAFVGRFVKTY